MYKYVVPDEKWEVFSIQVIKSYLFTPPIMFFSKSIAIAAAIGAVSAAPVESQVKTTVLPLKQVSSVKSAKSLVNRGHQRINGINGVHAVGPTAQASSGSITNEDVSYTAPISIGGNTWDLIVDTGCKSPLNC